MKGVFMDAGFYVVSFAFAAILGLLGSGRRGNLKLPSVLQWFHRASIIQPALRLYVSAQNLMPLLVAGSTNGPHPLRRSRKPCGCLGLPLRAWIIVGPFY